MSVQYSALRNYGVATLPSVDLWGTNSNILKNPPKAVFTRKIDKVDDSYKILHMEGETTTRGSENILRYPRGVNPFTAVNFTNAGTAGGLTQNGSISNRSQAYLPHRVAVDGVFRPPSRFFKREETTPLSRLPRGNTSANTNVHCIRYARVDNPANPREAAKPNLQYECNSTKTWLEQEGYRRTDRYLQRNMPSHGYQSQKTGIGREMNNIPYVKLRNKVDPGSYTLDSSKTRSSTR